MSILDTGAVQPAGLSPGLLTPGVIGNGAGGGLVEGEYLDTFAEAGPGLVSMGAPHTPNIDINLNGGTYVPSGAAPAGLANIDSAVNALVPNALDGQAAGGSNSFQLTDAAELRMLGTIPGAGAGSYVETAMQAPGGVGVQAQLQPTAAGVKTAGVMAAGGTVGVLGDDNGAGFGQFEVLNTINNGVLVHKLAARTPLYYNAAPLAGKKWQVIAPAIAGTVAGVQHNTANARLPTLSTAGLGGSGNLQDTFATDGDVRNGTPGVNGFGAPWQSSQGLPGIAATPQVVGGLLTWGFPFEIMDMPLGGFGAEAEFYVPSVQFAAADDSEGQILLNGLGFFGFGLALLYKTQTGGTEIKFDLVESQFGPTNVLKSVVVPYVASASLRFAYKQSAGKIAFQLGANPVEDIATGRNVTVRHLTCIGITYGGGPHTWDEVQCNQTATIL